MNRPEILFEEMPGNEGNLGLITLNRPEVLNALNQSMFLGMYHQLQEWSTSEHIKAVVIKAAEGRAFCAGGDIRSAYERGKAKDPTLPQFFYDEYQLNKLIYHFPKPYIALMDGITMGGGVGISIHGSHRVGTDRFVFAMPETAIGFYPDVGATYFLPRLTSKIGFYLGLVGEKLNCHDSYALGLLDHIVAPDVLPDILDKLADTPFGQSSEAAVSEILQYFTLMHDQPNLMTKQAAISTCFGKRTVSEILDALEHYPDAWCQQVATLMNTKSPTSLCVTLKQLQLGSRLKFDACMDLEYHLTCRFLQEHDFFEGIRAAIIDKDKNPKWKPAKISEVTTEFVESYFPINIHDDAKLGG